MNTRWSYLLAACMAVLLGGAFLASAAEPNLGQSQSAVQAPAGIIRISTLMGTTVLDPQAQKLGQIKDVVIDSQTGQGSFVVLDADVPGSGHAMLVVPYRALWVSVNPVDKRQSVVLDLRPDQLRPRRRFRKTNGRCSRIPSFWNRPATSITSRRFLRRLRLTTRARRTPRRVRSTTAPFRPRPRRSSLPRRFSMSRPGLRDARGPIIWMVIGHGRFLQPMTGRTPGNRGLLIDPRFPNGLTIRPTSTVELRGSGEFSGENQLAGRLSRVASCSAASLTAALLQRSVLPVANQAELARPRPVPSGRRPPPRLGPSAGRG